MIDEFEEADASDDPLVQKLAKKGKFGKAWLAFKNRVAIALHLKSTDALAKAKRDIDSRIALAKRFAPSMTEGLTDKEVSERKRQGLDNKSRKKYSKSYWEIIRTNVFTFFNVILVFVAVALLVSDPKNGWKNCTFLVIMILNIGIGIVQEIKSKKTIDKLRLVTAPLANVVRDGRKTSVPVTDLVLDDIVILTTGTQICADSLVKEGTIEVNEALLTGESLPIKKKPGDTVYAGSFVVSGQAKAQVNKVREANWAIGLQEKARQSQKNKSELLNALNAIIHVISLLVLPLAALMFTVNWMNSPGQDINEVANSAVAATAGTIVGMVPAGMFLLTSMALAVGVIRLSQKRTLVQNLYCFEMLARTNVLCLDKTGTLTDGTMEVNEVIPLDPNVNLNTVLGSYLKAFPTSNQTTLALAGKYPMNTELTPIGTVPFSSDRKWSAVSFRDNGTYILGAPEFVYQGQDKAIWDAIEKRQKAGYRVILLAHSDGGIQDNKVLGTIEPVALFSLVDHIRPDAKATIDWFQSNGVDIKIISGDNPYTAAEIAKNCGVLHTEKAISLEGLSLEETRAVADKHTVFGRVSPEQKAMLVKALRESGKTVSMTGDGVNDLLAMKQADCSIAMATGADATKSIASLVLLDSTFSSMPSVVLEGRRVINNIQRSSALYLMKTIFTIALSVIFVILGFSTLANSGGIQFTYPFQPSDLLLMEFVGIGVPSFFLALQPNSEQIKGHFLGNTFKRAVPGAIALLLVVGITYALAASKVFGPIGASELANPLLDSGVKCLTTLGLTFISLGLLSAISRPFNGYRLVLFIGDWLLLALLVSLFNRQVLGVNIFGSVDIGYLNTQERLTAFIYIFAAPTLVEFLTALFDPQTYAVKLKAK